MVVMFHTTANWFIIAAGLQSSQRLSSLLLKVKQFHYRPGQALRVPGG